MEGENSTHARFRFWDDERQEPLIFRSHNNRCLPHFHLAIELTYVLRGVMNCVMDGSMLAVQEGELLITSSYQIHANVNRMESDEMIFVIPLDYVPRIKQKLRHQCFDRQILQTPSQELVQTLLLIEKKHEDMSREALEGACQLALALAADEAGLREIKRNGREQLVQKMLLYMQEHYTEPLTLPDLAENVGYSTSRISHLFKESFGCSFAEYINGMRCKYAAFMLREGKATVTEIIMRAGFESSRTFYRVFHQMYGKPPVEYVNAIGERSNQPGRQGGSEDEKTDVEKPIDE